MKKSQLSLFENNNPHSKKLKKTNTNVSKLNTKRLSLFDKKKPSTSNISRRTSSTSSKLNSSRLSLFDGKKKPKSPSAKKSRASSISSIASRKTLLNEKGKKKPNKRRSSSKLDKKRLSAFETTPKKEPKKGFFSRKPKKNISKQSIANKKLKDDDNFKEKKLSKNRKSKSKISEKRHSIKSLKENTYTRKSINDIEPLKREPTKPNIYELKKQANDRLKSHMYINEKDEKKPKVSQLKKSNVNDQFVDEPITTNVKSIPKSERFQNSKIYKSKVPTNMKPLNNKKNPVNYGINSGFYIIIYYVLYALLYLSINMFTMFTMIYL